MPRKFSNLIRPVLMDQNPTESAQRCPGAPCGMQQATVSERPAAMTPVLDTAPANTRWAPPKTHLP